MTKIAVSRLMKKIVLFFIHIINLFLPPCADVIIVRPTRFGDMVMLYDCMRAIRERYEGKKILFVTSHCAYALAKLYGFFDKIIIYDSFFDCLRLIGLKAKILIVPVVEEDSAYIYKTISAKQRIAPDHVAFQNGKLTDLSFFNQLMPVDKKTVSDWVTNEKFTQAIVGSDYKIKLADFSCIKQQYNDYHKYFAVSLGSQDQRKNWPAERFAQMAQLIYDTYHIPCCLIGTEADRPLADIFLKRYHGECADLLGKTSLPELFSVLSDVRFVLCNDTGNMHAAIACRTKCFCIAADRWYPRFTVYPPALFTDTSLQPVFLRADYDCKGCFVHYSDVPARPNCENKILADRPYDCVKAITVEDVWNAVDGWLSDSQK